MFLVCWWHCLSCQTIRFDVQYNLSGNKRKRRPRTRMQCDNRIERNYDNVYHNLSIHFSWISARYQFCLTASSRLYRGEAAYNSSSNDKRSLEFARGLWACSMLTCVIGYHVSVCVCLPVFRITLNHCNLWMKIKEKSFNSNSSVPSASANNRPKLLPNVSFVHILPISVYCKRCTDDFHLCLCVCVLASLPPGFFLLRSTPWSYYCHIYRRRLSLSWAKKKLKSLVHLFSCDSNAQKAI